MSIKEKEAAKLLKDWLNEANRGRHVCSDTGTLTKVLELLESEHGSPGEGIRNRKGGKIMSKAKIIVAHYDDRGDPYPPNNYRPEIIIGAKRLVDLDAFNCSHNGCMPKEKAIKIAKSWSKQTGVEYKD